jgi:hypothetical protein
MGSCGINPEAIKGGLEFLWPCLSFKILGMGKREMRFFRTYGAFLFYNWDKI